MPRQALPITHLLTRLPHLRTIFLSSLALSITAACYLVYSILFECALPIRRAYYLETEYLYKLGAADAAEFLQFNSPNANGLQNPSRVRALIQDIPQLHYWRIPTTETYDELLGLYFDGLGWGEYKNKEYWIYFGGTPEGGSNPTAYADSKDRNSIVFEHRYKKHSCTDPPHICDSFNRAFDRISERWHATTRSGKGHLGSSQAQLRFVDCDVSPLLCGSTWGFGVSPVMLVHLKIGSECDWSIGVERCPVTWRLIGLPIREAPWTRKVRIQLGNGASTVVPAFPDAEEQMWALMAHEGAEEGLRYYPTVHREGVWNLLIMVNPVEGEMRAQYSYKRGLEYWAFFRSVMDHPFGWPREVLIRCYLERWLDSLLRWWDGPPQVATPRWCAGIEEEQERRNRKVNAFTNLVNNHGIDPRQIFIA